jgi:hypothetical protein
MIKTNKTKDDEIYDELSKRVIDVIYDHFPEGYQVDFLKVARHVAFAYFATISSQLANDPKMGGKLTPAKIVHMSNSMMNFIGHMLSKEGIAEPTTTEE